MTACSHPVVFNGISSINQTNLRSPNFVAHVADRRRGDEFLRWRARRRRHLAQGVKLAKPARPETPKPSRAARTREEGERWLTSVRWARAICMGMTDAFTRSPTR